MRQNFIDKKIFYPFQHFDWEPERDTVCLEITLQMELVTIITHLTEHVTEV